jgi:hypothetical protein
MSKNILKQGAKERPILFKSEMVRAILGGAKTQTRRICKNEVYSNGFHFDGRDIVCHNDYLPPSAMLMDYREGGATYTTSDLEGWDFCCPYGQPGDRLYVRETWAQPAALDPGPTVYRADYPACVPRGFTNLPPVDAITWKPSIHMRRALSRIMLEIVSVRVERLNDTSEADAREEGATYHEPANHLSHGGWSHDGHYVHDTAQASYVRLWESINGPGSWAANPWVWVVEFAPMRQEQASMFTEGAP